MAVNRAEQNVMQNVHPAFGKICIDRIPLSFEHVFTDFSRCYRNRNAIQHGHSAHDPQQLVIHTISQTEILALLDSWVRTEQNRRENNRIEENRIE
jgi:hypothetical protein